MANYPLVTEIADAHEVKAADGWVYTTATWSYASASTFTIAGDFTDRIGKGTRLRFTQTTVKYAVVLSASYGAPNTTVTIAVNTDYTIASAAMTSPAYSNADCPVGYPHWYNYTPTIAGFSANPASGIYKYKVDGAECTVVIRQPNNGTSNSTSFTITAPIVAATITNMLWCAYSLAVDNGANTTSADGNVASASTTITLRKSGSATGWTNSGGKSANLTLVYEV